MSHSRASLTKLFVRMSTIFNEIKIRYNEGDNARWHGQHSIPPNLRYNHNITIILQDIT